MGDNLTLQQYFYSKSKIDFSTYFSNSFETPLEFDAYLRDDYDFDVSTNVAFRIGTKSDGGRHLLVLSEIIKYDANSFEITVRGVKVFRFFTNVSLIPCIMLMKKGCCLLLEGRTGVLYYSNLDDLAILNIFPFYDSTAVLTEVQRGIQWME